MKNLDIKEIYISILNQSRFYSKIHGGNPRAYYLAYIEKDQYDFDNPIIIRLHPCKSSK